jgi:hypothetical protein
VVRRRALSLGACERPGRRGHFGAFARARADAHSARPRRIRIHSAGRSRRTLRHADVPSGTPLETTRKGALAVERIVDQVPDSARRIVDCRRVSRTVRGLHLRTAPWGKSTCLPQRQPRAQHGVLGGPAPEQAQKLCPGRRSSPCRRRHLRRQLAADRRSGLERRRRTRAVRRESFRGAQSTRPARST